MFSEEVFTFALLIYYQPMFKVIIAIVSTWVFCAILTAAGAFDHNSSARTDTKSSALRDSPWFRVPYPGNTRMYNSTLKSV